MTWIRLLLSTAPENCHCGRGWVIKANKVIHGWIEGSYDISTNYRVRKFDKCPLVMQMKNMNMRLVSFACEQSVRKLDWENCLILTEKSGPLSHMEHCTRTVVHHSSSTVHNYQWQMMNHALVVTNWSP